MWQVLLAVEQSHAILGLALSGAQEAFGVQGSTVIFKNLPSSQ